MKFFLTDLMNDLRERRLLPVAALLLAALVAVPILLLKPAKEPAGGPEPTTAAAPGRTDLAVQVADDGNRGSQLDAFDPKNPFKPPSQLLKPSTAADAAAAGTSSAAAGAGAGGAGTTVGNTISGGGGGLGGGSAPAPTRRRTLYTLVADVTFGRQDDTKLYRGLRRLSMLPSVENPLLLFLGVDSSGSNAVFLVDSSLRSTGSEGRCRPSKDECGFLYLGPGSEHTFVDGDGTTYVVRIEQIRRVKLGTVRSSRSSRRRAHTAGGKRDESSSTSDSRPAERRRFVPLMMLDLVAETSEGQGG